MTPKQAVAFMSFLGEKPVVSKRVGWAVFHCPLAPFRHKSATDKNPSFGVRIDGKGDHLHCWSCHFSGDPEDLLIEVVLLVHQEAAPEAWGPSDKFDLAGAYGLIDGFSDEAEALIYGGDLDEILATHPPELVRFPDHWIDAFPRLVDAGSGHPGVKYVVGRDMPEVVAQVLDLRWDAYRRRVCFPIRDFGRMLRGLHGRQIDGKSPPYLMYTYEQCSNPSVWLGEEWVDFDRPVLMVESVFDLARAVQVYRNTVTPLTSSINLAKMQRMNAAETIYTLFDADEAGDFASKKVMDYYGPAVVHHIILPDGEDASDISAVDLRNRLMAYGLMPDDIVV